MLLSITVNQPLFIIDSLICTLKQNHYLLDIQLETKMTTIVRLTWGSHVVAYGLGIQLTIVYTVIVRQDCLSFAGNGRHNFNLNSTITDTVHYNVIIFIPFQLLEH